MPFLTLYHKGVSQRRVPMNSCKRLVKRGNVYYIRARIPDSVQHLAKATQFFYSLKTYNYYEALAKSREESYKIDLKINLLKGLDMQIIFRTNQRDKRKDEITGNKCFSIGKRIWCQSLFIVSIGQRIVLTTKNHC